eukprot:gene6324-6974_t
MHLSSSSLPYPHLHLAEYPHDDYGHILGYGDPSHVPSRLQNISALRIADLQRSKQAIDTNGCAIDPSFYISADDLREEIVDFDARYGPPLNLSTTLRAAASSKGMAVAVAAEFKRASPSKGEINLQLDPVTQCLQYVAGGASVLSVLTESRHFRGRLDDMKRVRLATQAAAEAAAGGGGDRPAILRKDFIFDVYQLLEARAHGADTVLLIVAVLGKRQLAHLIEAARSLRMEPLVEVHSEEELDIAIACGAQVIGVNNRNLHNFHLDLQTTDRLLHRLRTSTLYPSHAAQTVQLAALSGISSREDVLHYLEQGVSCCLVGESLMKAADPVQKMRSLFSPRDEKESSSTSSEAGALRDGRLIAKVCGMTRGEDVNLALQAGAALVGVIFAPRSPRSLQHDHSKALAFAQQVRGYGERSGPVAELSTMALRELWENLLSKYPREVAQTKWFDEMAKRLRGVTERRPLLVGVFQDQSVEEMNKVAEEVGLDLIQLHGHEAITVADHIAAPAIRVLHIPIDVSVQDGLAMVRKAVEECAGRAVALLLDARVTGSSASGGSGKAFDWRLLEQLPVPVIVAGGLTIDNLCMLSPAQRARVFAVDVSSGVEAAGLPGVKESSKLRNFLSQVRALGK